MSEHQKRIIGVSGKVNRFFESNFCKVDVNGPLIDFDNIKGSPLMIVSSHRSHLDYFVIPYVFINKFGISNFRFAAGDNLTNLPYLGKKFKSLGAFTVKRDIGFDRKYIQRLCYDTFSMIEKGEKVLVFPEGGRSYNGDILPLRHGITASLIISQAKDYKRDVFFIPATVVYDEPPDVKWFSMLLKGKLLRKKGRSSLDRIKGNVLYFGADICAFLPLFFPKPFKRRHGNIYIDYFAPISIKSFIDIEANKNKEAPDEMFAHRVSMQKLSDKIFDCFYKLYRILPMHIVAYSLKQNNPISLEKIVDGFEILYEKLEKAGRNVIELKKYSYKENVEIGLEKLLRLDAVKIENKLYFIENKEIISYFAATVEQGAIDAV